MQHVQRRLRDMQSKLGSLPSKRPQAVDEVVAEVDHLLEYVERKLREAK